MKEVSKEGKVKVGNLSKSDKKEYNVRIVETMLLLMELLPSWRRNGRIFPLFLTRNYLSTFLLIIWNALSPFASYGFCPALANPISRPTSLR